MSTPTDELKIDLDEIDKKKADDAKKTPNAAEKDPVEVIRAEETPKTPEKDILKPEEGLEKLKKQLESEKQGRVDAERRAQEASEAERQAKTEVQDNNLHLVTTAIANVTQANDLLEGKYAEAMAAQDYAAAAKVQREMTTNAAKLVQLEQGKAALEKAPKPTARRPLDPIEEYAGRIPAEYPRSRTWIREHPEFVRDSQKNRQMIAAHEIALARGYTADTDEYFASIEKTLDLGHADPDPPTDDEVDPMKDTAKPAPRSRAAPAAAPVTRSGTGGGSRPNVVTLSPQEVEIAAMMKMTPEEYARQKIALKKEGRLN